jgi:signal transduction histidine kinase
VSIERRLGLTVFLAGLFGLALGDLALTREMDSVATVWPINALLLTVLHRWTRSATERVWILGGAAVALVAANLLQGSGLLASAVMSGLNLAEVVFGCWLLKRFGGPIDGPKPFLMFLLGLVVAAPLISALVVAGLFAVTQPGSNAPLVFIRWLVSDGLGMAVLAPFALTLRWPRTPSGRRLAVWPPFIGAQAAVLVASLIIFLQPERPPLFAIFPLLVLATISHRELGGLLGVIIASAVAVTATLTGRGPAVAASLVGAEPAAVLQLLIGCMVFTVLPVTALLRRLDVYAAELDQRRQAAEEISQIKTRLLAYVSHEIRSPLSGVNGLAQLMRDGHMGELTGSQREALEEIANASADLDILARDLTDAAAIQAGAAKVRIAAMDVAEAVRSAVAASRFRLEEYGASLALSPMPADLRVAADPLRVRQILVNLIVNAAKYGGRPPRIRIALTQVAGFARFEVFDNGAGIDVEHREALFKDFQRLGAEKSDVAGAGLGLALSHEMARLQGGRLEIVDTPAGETCFRLELPLAVRRVVAA